MLYIKNCNVFDLNCLNLIQIYSVCAELADCKTETHQGSQETGNP